MYRRRFIEVFGAAACSLLFGCRDNQVQPKSGYIPDHQTGPQSRVFAYTSERLTPSLPSQFVSCARKKDLELVADRPFYTVMSSVENSPAVDGLSVAMASRGHECVESLMTQEVLVCARRPGRWLLLLDEAGMIRTQIELKGPFSLEGHALWHQAGWLTSEYDAKRARAAIALRDHATLQVIERWYPGGVGFHQLGLLSDDDTLVIANGGIQFREDQHRTPLNLDRMDPSLHYFSLARAETLSEHRPVHHQHSVRHLAIDSQDRVLLGVQAQFAYPNQMPLVYTHSLYDGQKDLQPMLPPDGDFWQCFNQYTASVALGEGVGSVTSPRGNCVTFWDLSSRSLLMVDQFRDCAGVAFDQSNRCFVVSSGTGEIRYYHVNPIDMSLDRLTLTAREQWLDWQWDNHLLVTKG